MKPTDRPTRIPPKEVPRVAADTGEILGTTTYYPAVLPLSGIDFEQHNWPFFYVFALTNKAGAKRGGRYSVKAVTATGQLIVNGVTGPQKMGDFVEALGMPFQPEAVNDNGPAKG